MRIQLELNLHYPSSLKEKATDTTAKLVKAVEDALNDRGAYITSFKVEVDQ